MLAIDFLINKWKIDSIIFDLDGTLIDTLDKHIEAFEILFQELEISILHSQITNNMGRTPKDTLLSLIPDLYKDKKKLDELAKKKEQILTELLVEPSLLPGAFKLLEHLKNRKIPLCLASSTPRHNVQKILKITKLEKYFHTIITGEEILIGKPHPEIFQKASDKINVSFENCLVIGDSIYDVKAAKAAGMKIVAVHSGKHTKKQLQNENPSKIVSTLEELLK